MKKIILVMVLSFIAFACKEETKQEVADNNNSETMEQPQDMAYASYGEKIDDKNVMPTDKMLEKFQSMKVGDTVAIKTTAKVDEVCQAKGCWMKLNMNTDEQVMVKFKDYGFFMPKDIAGKEVIVNGKAYVNEMPVDEQKHYAEDAGASEEEIAAITAPKKTFSFEADGVLIKQ